MVDEIDARALRLLIENGAELQLVDIRPPEVFRTGHIPGSMNVPFEDFVESVSTVEWDDRIVLVCPYGDRSRQAAELLAAYEAIDEETNIYNLSDGLLGWNGPLVAPEYQ